jgi:hypothetical protein
MNPCLTPEQSTALTQTIHDSLPPGVAFVMLVFPQDQPPEGGTRTVGFVSSAPMPEAMQVIIKAADKLKRMMP